MQAAQPTPTAQVPDYVGKDAKLPTGVKLAYGMPNFAGAAMVIPIAIHMNIFYSDTILVPLGYIAIAVTLARSFDAITDPLMGWISDRTNTRWGRRRPWMFVGAPLAAISFVFLFSPPEALGATSGAVWFTVSFVAYFLFHTVYVIPHYGLGPELTSDYRERSTLFAWMEGFTLGGTMCAAALPGLVLFPLFGERLGFTVFAVLFGSILTLLYFWQCYRIQERPDFYQRRPNPLVPGMRRVMHNRPFRILLATYVVGSISGAIPGLMTPYFVTYVLQVDDPGFWIAIYLLVYFGCGFAALPLWLRAVRRFGKYPMYILSALMGIVVGVALFFQQAGDVWPTFGILVFGGLTFGVRIFLGPSIQADVIDYDELYSGKRREAQFGSLWALMTKFTVIPSAAVPLGIMATLGYEPNVEQTDTMQFTIRAIYGLVPAGTGALSLLIFLWFPINERNHRETLAGIEAHRRGDSVRDPLTGKLLPPPTDRGVDEETGWFLDHFSRREQLRYCRVGAGRLVWGAAGYAALSAALAGLFGRLIYADLGDLTESPGLLTVFEVLFFGLSVTGLLYHAIRVHAARRLARQPVPLEVVRSHLALTEQLRQ